mmetsp:Transcript_2407/g.7236  ORF Transcript_2407/g.7236 Transcript_2407/m.7236 type:complete len:210 (-) Transcript_2407:432-1061(-)
MCKSSSVSRGFSGIGKWWSTKSMSGMIANCGAVRVLFSLSGRSTVSPLDITIMAHFLKSMTGIVSCTEGTRYVSLWYSVSMAACRSITWTFSMSVPLSHCKLSSSQKIGTYVNAASTYSALSKLSNRPVSVEAAPAADLRACASMYSVIHVQGEISTASEPFFWASTTCRMVASVRSCWQKSEDNTWDKGRRTRTSSWSTCSFTSRRRS